jgi:hypothetical protein
VSFIDTERIEHAVEVSAASLYEACVLALAEFRRAGFADASFGPATELTVLVKAPATAHTVSVAKLRAWLSGGGKSPNELVAKKRLREVLGV